MKLVDIIHALEAWAPTSLQESYDNSGLLVGDRKQEVTNALICLDCTEDVVQEAIDLNCEMIIAHHPIVFSGLKSLTGKNYIERVVMRAIRNGIAIYAIHTNLDNIEGGVNRMISDRLGLENLQILLPKAGTLEKLVVFVPTSHEQSVMEAMFKSGAGHVGNYDECSFRVEGTGTFRAGEGTHPYSGVQGIRKYEEEVRLEVILPTWKRKDILHSMIKAHPYEEVAYDLHKLENNLNQTGAGMVGDLKEEVSLEDFFDSLKEKFSVAVVRHTAKLKDKVNRIAVCGGSGSFLLDPSKGAGADVFVTADFKYHQFFDAEEDIVIADIGHYESEHLIIPWIGAELRRKFPNFAIHLTKVNTNPVKYY